MSTAFTVALKAAPAICAVGVPVLPLAVPGALVSPGASNCSFTKAAGLTRILPETALLKLPLVNLRLIVLATLCDRLVKLTTPPIAVIFVAPWRVPLPAFRVAVTTVLLSLARKLPNWSSIRTAGCGAKDTPAVAVGDGCVRIVSRLAAAGTMVVLDEVTVGRPVLLAKLRLIVSAVL